MKTAQDRVSLIILATAAILLFTLTIAGTRTIANAPLGAPEGRVGLQEVDQICTFETKEAHYARVTSPPEYLAIKWHTATGRVESFQWNQGGTTWFSYPQDPGSVTQASYYNLVNLRITWSGLQAQNGAYSIKGSIAPNVHLPAATFAGIYEGTGTAWFVAYGSLTCVDAKKSQ